MAFQLAGVAPLLQVFDMPASIRFYRDILGFAIVTTSPMVAPDDCGWALLRRDGIELMLNTAYDVGDRPPERDTARERAHEDTILYFGCRDVDAAYAELRAAGVVLDPPKVAPYGMKQLNLHDPDGFAICLQWEAADGESGAPT